MQLFLPVGEYQRCLYRAFFSSSDALKEYPNPLAAGWIPPILGDPLSVHHAKKGS
jgi:hypothetical protein